MVKVITYGTYDLLHYGHIRLLERAKALGDYLIVGITSDDYDKTRGKINNQQSLIERIEAVKATGIADEIIVEEYEGQKIDDIRRYQIDIFAIGSDWEGKFDYLNDFCKVVYLPRTEGVSSSAIRAEHRKVKIGFIGDNESRILNKYCEECKYVNGAEIVGICTTDKDVIERHEKIPLFDDYDSLLNSCEAVYIITHPSQHYEHIKKAILRGKHVLVEMPVVLTALQCEGLFELAAQNHVILMPAMKTAYATAYNRMLLLLKSGKIGRVVSVDATCTSIRDVDIQNEESKKAWNSICAWGPTAMLPIFQILGIEYQDAAITSYFIDKANFYDAFTRISFLYENAVATMKVGRGVKSEGDLVVTGTKGYLYVPAPWWKTDYFEVRYENSENNRRYFYQLDGEGIRYMLVAFVNAIKTGHLGRNISDNTAIAISRVMDQFYRMDLIEI